MVIDISVKILSLNFFNTYSFVQIHNLLYTASLSDQNFYCSSSTFSSAYSPLLPLPQGQIMQMNVLGFMT